MDNVLNSTEVQLPKKNNYKGGGATKQCTDPG